MAQTMGHPAALTESVVRREAEALSRFIRALGGPQLEPELEDILQEVFLVAHRRWPTLRSDIRLSTWLCGIAQNVVRNRRRAARWRGGLGGSASEVAGHLPAREASALEDLESAEAKRKVYGLLNQLNERHRTALILFELEERPAAEISELMGVAPSTVWVWVHRGRTRFLELLRRAKETEARK
jgi:RNA polymerase sigma-70 factor (ECF subfamily)